MRRALCQLDSRNKRDARCVRRLCEATSQSLRTVFTKVREVNSAHWLAFFSEAILESLFGDEQGETSASLVESRTEGVTNSYYLSPAPVQALL